MKALYQKTCTVLAYILERFLLICGCIFSAVSFSASLLSIVKVLYITKHQGFWTLAIMGSFFGAIACIVLFAILRALIEVSGKHNAEKILTREKAEKRMKWFGSKLGVALGILGMISLFIARVHWGGDVRSFTGDEWWKFAGTIPMVLGIVMYFFKWFQELTWKWMIENMDNVS